MKKRIAGYIVAGMLLISGCNIIKEQDRLIPIESESVAEKKVLLLEFTDQNCRNCVNATVEISNLLERFSDTLVAISIHANPISFPLTTQEGNQYEEHFQAQDHPDGIVDGGGGGKYRSHDPQVWGGFILERLQMEPTVTIDLNTTFNDTGNEGTVNVQLSGKKALSNVKLLLWIIESNIRQWQLMPDGTRNNDYIHNHVFRASINGTWGEPFSIEANGKEEFNYSFTLNSAWKPENIAIAGFVYDVNTDEVFNVQEISLIKQTE
jgi:hypothetical protein